MQPVSATLAMFASLVFVVLLALLHVVRADMDPSWHMVSEYANGPSGWMMAGAFFALATSFISLAVASLPSTRGVLGSLALVFLVIAGIGAAIVLNDVWSDVEAALRNVVNLSAGSITVEALESALAEFPGLISEIESVSSPST